MLQLSATQQAEIKELISSFIPERKTNYTRMSDALTKIIGKTPDNAFVWVCVNKAEKSSVPIDSSFLD